MELKQYRSLDLFNVLMTEATGTSYLPCTEEKAANLEVKLKIKGEEPQRDLPQLKMASLVILETEKVRVSFES